MNRRSFRLGSLALASCSMPAGEPPRVAMEASRWLHGDTRFTREERWLVELATDAWRKFTRNAVNLAVAWDLDEARFLELRSEPRILRLYSTDARVSAVDGNLRGRGRARGYQHGPRGDVPGTVALVVDRLPEFYPAILHERPP
jgi:hypothetical protein